MDLLARQRKSWCVSCSITEKSSWILREITSNFKERAKFRTRKKTIVSLKFSGIMNAISEQKISHVTDVYVTADLYRARPDKPKIFWHYEITMLLIVHEYTLFVCIWSRHLKLYLRKWSLIQISLKKHSVHITWISISISTPILGLAKFAHCAKVNNKKNRERINQ